MKKRAFSFVLALLLCAGLAVPAMAAEYKVTEVVPFKYDWMGSFHDGLAQVALDSGKKNELNNPIYKHGFIDATGKEIVPCKYDQAEDFSDGLAAVLIGDYITGKYGYIDKTGKEVIPCQYDYAEGFSDGLAAVLADSGKKNEDGYPIYTWGLIDKTGKEVVPCKYGDYDGLRRSINTFCNGLAAVMLNGKYGFIDATGKEVIPCQYDYAEDFSEGLAVVQVWEYPDCQCGFIDKTGKEVISFKYDDAENFSEGLAAVELNDKWGFIDKTGREVIPCKYDWANSFSDGLAAVRIGDWEIGKWGFIDKAGREVVPCKYDSAYDFSQGFAVVGIGDMLSGREGLIDKTGKEIVPCKYQYVGPEGPLEYKIFAFEDGLMPVMLNDKWGFIDTTGKEVVPCKYDRVENFSDGLAAVCVGEYPNSKWGFIDKTGKEVIPCKYDYIYGFSDGLAAVDLNGKCGVLSIEEVNTAYARSQRVEVDGALVSFPSYALKDDAGNETNYVKVRDFALILNQMTEKKFNVTWNADLGAVDIVRGEAYAPNGSELATPFSGDRAYETPKIVTLVDGEVVELDTFQLKDDNGGGYTYYKLRDLGEALGIKVDWSKDRGIFIETR